MAAGLRFPGTAHYHGWFNFGGVTGGFSQDVPVGATYISTTGEPGRVYIAPSRYSEVRKITFQITFQHNHADTQPTWTVSPRIAPSSSSSSAKVLEWASIPPSSNQTTTGPAQIWSSLAPEQAAAWYDMNGTEDAIVPLKHAVTDTGQQCVTMEFDRTNAADADFWADWDAAAAEEDDDLYIAYWPGLQRNDLAAWGGGGAATSPIIDGMGITVVQAPSAENNTCTTIVASAGLYPDNQMGTGYTGIRMNLFPFVADDWDNITAIHLILRQTTRNNAIKNGDYTVRIRSWYDQTFTSDTRLEESFGPGQTGSVNYVSRTADIKDLIQSGDSLGIDFKSDSGFGNQNMPWGHYEVIQKNCTKKAVFHPCGQGNAWSTADMQPSAPPPDAWARDQMVFDPDWYENYPASKILHQRFYGGFTHYTGVKNSDQTIFLNTDIGADMPNAVFNAQGDEISSTPDVDQGVKTRYQAITRTNPLLLSGKRVMKMVYGLTDWESGDDDQPGCMGFAYVLEVPNSEFLTLGPLFELGEFDPNGCASTAAGLGDDPGILFMTNGSTVPKKFDPRSGLIDNAGICQPYRDEVPTTSVDSVSISPDGGIEPGFYSYRYTLRNCCTGKESDPNPTSIIVDASLASPGAAITLNFSGVTIPGDSQICEICIYRSVIALTEEAAEALYPAMAKIGCFDPDDTSIFVDTTYGPPLEDFASDPLSTLNACPPCFAVVVEFRNRLFGLVDIPNLDPPGLVDVTNGSDVISGDSETGFDRCVLGKYIQIQGDCTAYEVLELLVPTLGSPEASHGLKIDRPYEGVTDSALNYIICGHPNRLYISEPLEPEYWLGINYLDVDPGDGDFLTGAVSNFNRLVIFKRRKTYVVAFREQPIVEIVVPTLVSRDIGCIAPRSVAQVNNGSVWLADRGLAIYDGRGVSAVPECAIMNDLFSDPENPNYLRRDTNGRAIGAAGVFYPKREQYLLLLPTVQTVRGANMILVWDTELRNCTLLQFCQEFLSIEVAKDSDGNERVYLGDTDGFVWIWDVGDTDGVGFPNATGTVRGTISGAGLEASSGASYLEDDTASFVTGGVPGVADLSGLAGTSGLTGLSNMGLAGVCVFWREADAPLDTPWQSRSIYFSTPTRLYVTPNWGAETPEVGDEYMIGPIRFEAEFKPTNYGTDDFTKRDWRQVIVHEPEAVSTTLRTELLRDFQNSDVDEDTVTDSAGETGEGRTFDLGFGQGRQLRPVGRLVHNFMGVRLSNFAPDEPLTIINHLLMVTPRTTK